MCERLRVLADAALLEWCEANLGARPDRVLWRAEHLSSVTALALDDGRRVVVKARPWAASLPGCHVVHAHVHRAGFPCPRPLTGPVRVGGLAVSAEEHVPGGTPGRGDDPALASRSAVALAHLHRLTPAVADVPCLEPPRPWAGWADPRAAPWPPPDEGEPLNDAAATAKLRPLAWALNERLRADGSPVIVGHVDWYQGNLRWDGDALLAVDDWDSAVALSEPSLVGCAAASFHPGVDGVHPEVWPGAEVEDTAAFASAYASAIGHSFGADATEIMWAAGLWQRVFDAAKSLVRGRPDEAAGQLRDADERTRLAGL